MSAEFAIYGCMAAFFLTIGVMCWYALHRYEEAKQLMDDGWRIPSPSKHPPPPDRDPPAA